MKRGVTEFKNCLYHRNSGNCHWICEEGLISLSKTSRKSGRLEFSREDRVFFEARGNAEVREEKRGSSAVSKKGQHGRAGGERV